MMTHPTVSRGLALPFFIATFAVPTALAHSLQELEQDIIHTEKYFQPEDKQAPSFTLQDADGKTVSLSDFMGKVVVLHFI